MKEWKPKLFKDVAEFPPKISLEKGRSYSFIPMEDLNSGFKYAIPKTEKVWTGSGGARFEEGDTLFARITPCLQNGKISQARNLVNNKGFGSTEYFIFRGVKNVSDTDFIYYVARTEEFRKHAIGSMVGASGRQRADATFVGNFELKLPPLQIQNRIAKILSAFDDLIENNLNRIKLLEEFAQRTYEEWFVKFRIDDKNLKINKETHLPDGWKRKKLGEVVDFLSRGISPKYVESSGLKILNQKCIRNGLISLAQSRLTANQTKIPHDKYLQLYDVVVNSTGAGTLGRIAQVINIDQNITVDTHVSIIRANREAMSPVLLGFAIKSQEELITNMGKGSTNQLELSRNDLRDLVEIIVPNLALQNQFDELIEPGLKLISTLTKQNAQLEAARDILLPRLMNGEIELK